MASPGQASPGIDDGVIYSRHLGYFMSCELNPEPIDVQKEVYQLDKKLIKEINNMKNGYEFTGSVADYGYEHRHEEILKNTVILENYVNKIKPRKNNNKLRIFVRGGALVNFIAGTVLRIPITTLNFEYDEEENILRLVLNEKYGVMREPDFTMIGEHRLTGDKSEVINFGNNLYRVMELCTEEYELYYSKEFDGFDGDEPIEIRGADQKWGLHSLKIQYRSAALADIKKLVIMISDNTFLVHRVTIIDDFTKHDRNPNMLKNGLYKEINSFFNDYIPIMKQFKKGKISKTSGGIIIEPKKVSVSDKMNVSIVVDEVEQQLRRLLNLNWSCKKVIPLQFFNIELNQKLFLCLNSPHLVREALEVIGRRTILGCFIEHENLQVPEGYNKRTDYFPAVYYWRKIIYSINPDLLQPMPISRLPTCVLWPYFNSPPFLKGHVINNKTLWGLSENMNLIFAEKREDLKMLLEHLSLPLPDFNRRIPMTVYTQEECKDILVNFFGTRIIFEESRSNDIRMCHKILCTIKILPEESYRSDVLGIFNSIEPTEYWEPRIADLYLIGRNNVIQEKWNNKYDLQLLDNFTKLDPIRQFPRTVVLFSDDLNEYNKVERILSGSHSFKKHGENMDWSLFGSR